MRAGALRTLDEAGLGPETGTATIAIIFAIGRFAVAMRHMTRGARYYAAVHVKNFTAKIKSVALFKRSL